LSKDAKVLVAPVAALLVELLFGVPLVDTD
jgi:hypothetical protein